MLARGGLDGQSDNPGVERRQGAFLPGQVQGPPDRDVGVIDSDPLALGGFDGQSGKTGLETGNVRARSRARADEVDVRARDGEPRGLDAAQGRADVRREPGIARGAGHVDPARGADAERAPGDDGRELEALEREGAGQVVLRALV